MITNSLNSGHRLVYFAGIGGTCALVHIITVLNLVTYLQLDPLVANVIAFLLAFNISFIGHKHLTFSRRADQKQLSLPHFFFVATSAGILNELFYAILLEYTHLNYLISLVLVLGSVSIYSFFVSKLWACR